MDYNIIAKNLSSSYKNMFQKTGGLKAIIGISGGIDSAVVSAIACHAIGAENVLGYYLPYKKSSQESLKDSKILAEKYGFKLEIIDISKTVDSFLENIEDITPLRKGNIMSRSRMVYLFDKAAEHKAIVTGTTNRTELLLGYGTWYGDTASSINIIGSLYKREVYGISSALDMPKSIMEKSPTADLWQGQTDEEEIGFTYELLDNLFYDIEQNQLNKESLYSKYGKEVVEKLVKRVVNNSFKRHIPLICESNIENRKKIDENIFLNLDK